MVASLAKLLGSTWDPGQQRCARARSGRRSSRRRCRRTRSRASAQQAPLERPGQPAELAPIYVLLASDEASYMSGSRVAVTGGNPIL